MIGNLAALAVALSVSLAIGEAAIRAVVTLPLPRVQPEVRYLPHPVRRFTLARSQTAYTYGAPVVIDARGFRANGAAGGGESGGSTVLALGDSFTFGLGVGDRETWPARLESDLRARTGRPIGVVNAGTISYGVFQEMDLLRSAGLAVRPSVVVHALYWNDFMNAEPPAADAPSVVTEEGYFVWDQPVERGPFRHAASLLTSRSALYFSLRMAVSRFRSRGTGAYERAYSTMLASGLTAAEWGPIEAFYRDLAALGHEAGFSIFAVIMPVNDLVARSRPASHPYAIEARRRLEALGVPYLDAFQLWESQGLGARPFLPQGPDAHLDAAGYEAISRALADRLMADPHLSDTLRASR